MRFRFPFLRFLALPALLGALFLAACHLGGEEKVEATISFNQIFDSLKQYDHVVISLKDAGGNTIDVVFDGQVKVPGDVEKLAAPHWDGGPITVSIIGYKEGKIVYNTETGFDGRSNKKDSTYVFVDPIMGLLYSGGAIPMLEGDSINLPSLTITPANLKVKTLNWVSSAPDVVRIGATGFKALKAGNAQITVSLVADSAKQTVISVTVVDPAKIPESLSLSADTLKLSAGGAPGRLELQFIPTTSAKDVVWSILDTTIAAVAADGTVQGRKAGETRLIVISSLKASATDTAVITVTQPMPPEKVVFAKAETEIFVGGAAESLLVAILPPEANQEVEFSVTTPLLIELKNGRISGLAAGDGLVIAKSKENGSLLDTLKVKITIKQVVTSVTISKKSLTVFTGGDEPVLTATIEPTTSNQKVQWRADQTGIAKVSETGKVTGVSPGHTTIHAISLVDSTKQDSADITVKTDAPVVNIGRPDTTVSVGSSVKFLPVVPTQEFGVVVAFRWDVDGLPGWDDTAKVVQEVTVKFDQEKDYTLRFYVRDSEGNETIATKKVSAVIGPVVTIVEPADGAYFTKPAIKIVWKIDNAIQITGNDTVLKDGANTITRSAKDAAGKVFPASVTVYLDSVPPAKPTVKGPAGISSGKPTWTWNPGGGGNGTYRIAVDSQVFVGAGIKDTLYIPEPALSEGLHTLYVQERDAAGNWSLPGKITTAVDLTGPTKPIVTLNVPSPSNTKKPTWSWSTGGGAGNGVFQFKFGNADFTTGASTPGTETQFIPAANLGDGNHILYVRERDSLGNWSELGNAAITIDTTAPGAPKLLATSPTSIAPKWTWSSGGGGNGTYRFKIGGEPAGTPEVTVLEHILTGAVSKTTYILYVQERDAVGNWSPSANMSVLYDLSKPSVTITAPQASGTYLTKLAAVDLAGTSTSPQGAGSIKSITYTVDGVAGSLSTNMDANGGWNIKALALTNNKTIAVKVMATDVANNVGEATLNILMDNTAPTAPAFTVQPPSIVNKDDLRTSLAWTWGRTGDATDSFVVKLNGAEVARQVGTSYSHNSLTDGTYLLEVSEKDLTGNASGFTPATSVLVDRVAPNTPTPSVSETPTRDNTPTWTWSSSGGNGNFEYRIASGAAPTGTGIAIAATTYTPNPALADGTWHLQARERDAAGNWSAWSGSSSATIKVSAPSAPAVTRNAATTNAPKWSWSQVGGGNGTFRFRWSGAGSYLGEGAGTEYAPTNLSENSHNLCVSEKDLIGYGVEACLSIVVDKTGPVITGIDIPDGFITNSSPLVINFKKDGVSDTVLCYLANDASKSCSKTVYDAANNPATVSRTVWYRNNVIFVRQGKTGGNGSDWDAAYGDITTAISSIGGQSGRFEIWVGEGAYAGFTLARSTTSIYGGFNSTGYPNSIAGRDLSTKVSRIRPNGDGVMVSIRGESPVVCRNAIVDGFHINDEIGQAVAIGVAENARLENFWVETNRNTEGGAGLIAIYDGYGVFEKVYIRDNYSQSYAAIYLYSGGKVEMSNSELINNSTGTSWGGPGIHQEGGGGATIRSSLLYKNAGGSNSHQVFNYGGGLIDIDGCTVHSGRSGVYPLAVDDPNSEAIKWGPNNKTY